ncbi:Uncharacterized protein Rs2_02123 [Raphanus sativus]|nr:Uncharacterized protein Rs2_02123 [Raphanus sativus]
MALVNNFKGEGLHLSKLIPANRRRAFGHKPNGKDAVSSAVLDQPTGKNAVSSAKVHKVMPAVSSAVPIQPSKTVVSSVKVDKRRHGQQEQVNIFAKADDFQNQAHSHEDYSRRFKHKGSIFAKANDFQNQAQPPEDFASRFEPKTTIGSTSNHIQQHGASLTEPMVI